MTSPIPRVGGGNWPSNMANTPGNNPSSPRNSNLPTSTPLNKGQGPGHPNGSFWDDSVQVASAQSASSAPLTEAEAMMLDSARNISKDEMLQALTVMENLSGHRVKLGPISISLPKPQPDNRINLKELNQGCQRLLELLDQPPEKAAKGLTELRGLDKTWKEALNGSRANPVIIWGHYIRMFEVADFMRRHGRAIAGVDGDDLISRNDIEKLWKRGLLADKPLS